MTESAWETVTKRTLTPARKKLWPEYVVECNFEGFATVLRVDPVVNEIVSLTTIMGLEVDNNEFDELMELHSVSRQEMMESLSDKEEEVTIKQQSSGAIREMLKAWELFVPFIEKHHPNKAVATRIANFLLFFQHGRHYRVLH